MNDGLYTVSREVDATDQQIILEEDLIDEAAGATIVISSPGAQLTEMDSDGDGLTDFYEELLGLDPGTDSDGDGLIDDTDGDGFPMVGTPMEMVYLMVGRCLLASRFMRMTLAFPIARSAQYLEVSNSQAQILVLIATATAPFRDLSVIQYWL